MSGLEDLLIGEIIEQGGTNTEKLFRAVSFEATLEELYKINYWSRTALRVIKPFLEFKAHNETVYYKRLRRYDWTSLFRLDQTFKINSSVHSDRFTHSQYVALKAKDAIVDQFREVHDQSRPSIDIEDPDLVFDIHCNGIDFIISMDSSGESLHKRGYRQSRRKAPLNETLAAGLVLLSGWDKKSPLLDPMCGSGTILSEAYYIAHNIPPRINREFYCFMNWANFDSDLWDRVVKEGQAKIKVPEVDISGYDIDGQQIEETKTLFQEMKISHAVSIKRADFFQSTKSSEQGMIIMNPPYGLRIEEDDIIGFYKNIGDTFKKSYQGWSAWVISGNKDAIKSLGLRTSKKLTLYNGSLECKYHKYDMYRGTKKDKSR